LERALRQSASRTRTRGQIVIVTAVALCAFLLPAPAQAHGRAIVRALDYEARPTEQTIGPGVRARVIDGDRSLELTVAPNRVVLVDGYIGEPFVRFSERGVEANVHSPTAIADKLVSTRTLLMTGPRALPRWTSLTSRHRLTWHDHRLGPTAGLRPGEGPVGRWTVPIRVDGRPSEIGGAVWRAERPATAPWLVLWLLSLAGAGAVAWLATPRLRALTVFAAAGISSALVLLVSLGFTLDLGRSGFTRWLDLALPAGVALAAAALVLLSPRRRYVSAGIVGGLSLAFALEDISVFQHGFVVSALSGPVVRAAVAAAIAAGTYAIVVVLADLLRGEQARQHRPKSRAQPRFAIPRGKPR
jgi:hypothetical protein